MQWTWCVVFRVDKGQISCGQDPLKPTITDIIINYQFLSTNSARCCQLICSVSLQEASQRCCWLSCWGDRLTSEWRRCWQQSFWEWHSSDQFCSACLIRQAHVFFHRYIWTDSSAGNLFDLPLSITAGWLAVSSVL